MGWHEVGADPVTPTPPPGFELDQPFGGAPPPPPPGFELDQPAKSEAQGKPQDWISKYAYTPLIEGTAMGAAGAAGAVMGAPAGLIGSGLAASGMAAAAYPPAKRFAASIDKMRGIDNPVNAPKPLFDQAKDVASDFGEGAVAEAGGKVIGKAAEMAAPYAKSMFQPIANKVSDAAGDVAQSAGRRALGFTKRFLNKPGNLDRANSVSQEMLDQGAITNPITHPFSSGSESIDGRIDDLLEKSGQKMGSTRQILDTNKIPGPDATESAVKVIDKLKPQFSDEKSIANEIGNDMTAISPGRMSYDDAFTVLQKLKQKAKYSPMGGPTDQLRANMYRKAYGIFSDELDQAIDRGSTMLGDYSGTTKANYEGAKSIFGKSSDAKKAITNKISSEAGNNRIGLREAALGAAELAAGNPGKAAATIGAMEGVKRFGNAALATTADTVAKGAQKVPALFEKPAQGAGVEAGETALTAASRIPAMVLTEKKAREYLQKAKGDKDKARAMATSDGWSF